MYGGMAEPGVCRGMYQEPVADFAAVPQLRKDTRRDDGVQAVQGRGNAEHGARSKKQGIWSGKAFPLFLPRRLVHCFLGGPITLQFNDIRQRVKRQDCRRGPR